MAKSPSIPFPKVGDHVLIGHNNWSDPDCWWASRVEWSNGEAVLVRYAQGWHPTYEPMLYQREAIILFGTKEDCEAALRVARAERRQHDEAIRNANLALQAEHDMVAEAVRSAVEAESDRLALAGGE